MAEQESDKGGSVAEQHSEVEGTPDATSSHGAARCDLRDEETRLAVQKALDDALITVGLGELSLSREGEGESNHGPTNNSGIAETYTMYIHCTCRVVSLLCSTHPYPLQVEWMVYCKMRSPRRRRRSPWRWWRKGRRV